MKKLYLFSTRVYTKEKDNIWCENPNDLYRSGETLEEALDEYMQAMNDRHNMSVSKNARKHKEPIYYDDIETGKSIQSGYTMKASIEIFDDRYHERRWKKYYIDLWVDIREVINPFKTV